MYKIMIIEDNERLKDKLKKLLVQYGYSILAPSLDEHIINSFKESMPHLVLLDINLPCFDGFHFCREIRKISNVPIIFVTSRSNSMDEVMGMTLGGDDFITKPYKPEVLLARIGALLRRSYSSSSDILEHNGLTLNLGSYTAVYKEKSVDLSKNEYRILYYLMKNNGKLISREELMKQLWNEDVFLDDNTLTVNINRLRRKLEDIKIYDYIITKHGQGYMIT
ncbi:response regulator transcription factor [Anaerosacchariphilus polymeriproducens]|uniref:Stage 0 sporulation protein A homolog n=1 Tax=Anaerosacchariphilus polymeriproducens TaxID=1812858 RepID=A0A371AYW4_9FIRM|nr:response regulator transcription factor [Anaerosacchariphilus polymeriproducens]RDU24757.1 DNA-binding response regulator [Anaerosacchariphilus polymeriproducens]